MNVIGWGIMVVIVLGCVASIWKTLDDDRRITPQGVYTKRKKV